MTYIELYARGINEINQGDNMKYELTELGIGKYTLYFFKKGFKKVFAINTNGDVCQANIEQDYSPECGVELKTMISRFNELPKYITKNLSSHKGGF
jgi:hypothetical protein